MCDGSHALHVSHKNGEERSPNGSWGSVLAHLMMVGQSLRLVAAAVTMFREVFFPLLCSRCAYYLLSNIEFGADGTTVINQQIDRYDVLQYTKIVH